MNAGRTHCSSLLPSLLLAGLLVGCSSPSGTEPRVESGAPPITGTDTTKPAPAPTRKASYGHYFAANQVETPADVAMLCEQAGVAGVVYRRAWRTIEPHPAEYDFSAVDRVLDAIAGGDAAGARDRTVAHVAGAIDWLLERSLVDGFLPEFLRERR